MAVELAYVLINPYTIAKSRTGGVIARFISRTGLDLVAARMYGPSKELAERYAALLREDSAADPDEKALLSDYVARAYAPDPATGKRRRVLMLLFEGEDAVAKVTRGAGHFRYGMESAETVRGTYGDYVRDAQGQVQYVEPAVMVSYTPDTVASALRLWAAYCDSDGGILEEAVDVSQSVEIQKTLVLIKPDNFRFPSARPGNIIDLFSASGLRIIGAKVHRMSVAEAEEFYGPVRQVLREKLKGKVAERAGKALSTELGFEMPQEIQSMIGDTLGPLYGDHQFFQIVQFMTGCWAPQCSEEYKTMPGKERCLALVYSGPKAVEKIRGILGPTDPSKAQPGSVRREFGQDIMVNAAHASDSPENATREMRIVKVEQGLIKDWTKKYYG